MSTFRTSLGQEFVIERRLPKLGWKPELRGRDLGDIGNGFDVGGDDIGVFAILGIFLLLIFLILVGIPLLIFVLEVALLLALIIPLTILALAVGLKQHLVVLRDAQTQAVIDQRSVHGVIGSVRAARALKSAAGAGAYQR